MFQFFNFQTRNFSFTFANMLAHNLDRSAAHSWFRGLFPSLLSSIGSFVKEKEMERSRPQQLSLMLPVLFILLLVFKKLYHYSAKKKKKVIIFKGIIYDSTDSSLHI
jgi:hypothetical protein